MIIINSMDSYQTLHGEQEADWLEILPEDVTPHPVAGDGRKRIRLWALTLDSRSVPCQIHAYGNKWRLLVPPERYALATSELRCFEELNRNWPPPAPEAHPLDASMLATLSVLILLATFYILSHMDPGGTIITMPDCFGIGSAKAARILDGQWWRGVTALTLHSDAAHLLGNLSMGGVFIFLLCRQLGSGLAWSLILASGTLGNLINASLQTPLHNSVGASTAVFGTVGILAALTQMRYRHFPGRRWLLPAAASLALLALLGSEGKQTDLGAHLFGLACGIPMGLAAEYLTARYGHPGPALNILLGLFSAVALFSAWWLALVNAV